MKIRIKMKNSGKHHRDKKESRGRRVRKIIRTDKLECRLYDGERNNHKDRKKREEGAL